MNKIAYKFVNHDIPDLDTLKNERPYILATKVAEGIELTREEKNEITFNVYVHGGGNPCWKRAGYAFDFRPVLKSFYVKQYGQVDEYFAFDRTSLRSILMGRVDNITEVQ